MGRKEMEKCKESTEMTCLSIKITLP